MYWFEEEKEGDGVSICSRFRVKRNFADYTFSGRIGTVQARAMIEKATATLQARDFVNTDAKKETEPRADRLAECGYFPASFSALALPHAAFFRQEDRVAVAVGGDAAIAFTVICRGLASEHFPQTVLEETDRIDAMMPFAFDTPRGYLFASPTETGSGTEEEILLFLPALAVRGKISTIASGIAAADLSLSVFEENGVTHPWLYRLCAKANPGMEESAAHRFVQSVAKGLVDQEQKSRAILKNSRRLVALSDGLLRDVGILSRAILLEEEEMLPLFSTCAFAMQLGVLPQTDRLTPAALLPLYFSQRNISLFEKLGNAPHTSQELAQARAAYIRSLFFPSVEAAQTEKVAIQEQESIPATGEENAS